MKILPINNALLFKKHMPEEDFRANNFEYNNPHDVWIERIVYNVTPKYAHYEGKLEEYALKKKIATLVQKPKTKTVELNEIDVANLRDLPNNSYRGESLFHKKKYLENFKEAGVKQIIDLHCFMGYKEICEQNGLSYFPFKIDDKIWRLPVFLTKNEYVKKCIKIREANGYSVDFSKEQLGEFAKEQKIQSTNFINKFIKFIEIINNGNFYLGCSFGVLDTNKALLLNQFFNPKNNVDDEFMPNEQEIKAMSEFYKKLTAKNKKELGWDNNFEQELKIKLKIKK